MNDSSDRVSPANTVKLQLRNSSTHTLQHTISMFLDSLVYRPNRIPERQRVFQAATHLPVYRRGKYSNILLRDYHLYWVVCGG
ncbi:hypothetical protein SCLCIDRAFT_1214049 [Scleroderma citrinum Foug A]|uniref:Uncharacterized protein n=1 Tax=Scleroderma citrinum Foug A TaxID=1036808 RepID=A0A0C3E6P0_9AGAM|nr:hypothetical protein SCLCIDRAFT_1214049 [Scleroderma citrinum Foug A]